MGASFQREDFVRAKRPFHCLYACANDHFIRRDAANAASSTEIFFEQSPLRARQNHRSMILVQPCAHDRLARTLSFLKSEKVSSNDRETIKTGS
jgi:hypothetical protein